MKIPIPEVNERFDSTEDALEYIVRLSNVIVDKSKKICPNPSVDHIPAYVLEFCNKVLLQAKTIVKVSREREDYNTLCALVRILADNIATLNFVYDCQDDEERALRHFLYVIDGVTVRHRLLMGHPMKYDGKIPKETYDALEKQVEGAKDNTERCIRFCTNAIKRLPVYAMNGAMIDDLIKNGNWKFKTIDKPQPRQGYTWKELYGMLHIKTGDEMFPYLSQYVHGLSVSNIVLNDKDDFDAPLSFAVCLAGWLLNYLRKVYEPHIGTYTMEDINKVLPGLFDEIR